jgi:uncharacterized protein (TIGR03083 family)
VLDDYLALSKDDVGAGLRVEQARVEDLVSDLDDTGLGATSLCPDWRVRDVVAHLTGIAADVLAGDTSNAGKPEVTARHVAVGAAAPVPDLLAEFTEARRALADLVESLDQDAWESELPSGQQLGHGAERLLEDIWVHANDIAVPLGLDPVDGPGVAATLNVVLWEWRQRLAHFSPDLAVVVRTGHAAVPLGPSGSDGEAASIEGDPALVALVASSRLTGAEASAIGRFNIVGDVSDEVVDIYGEPVPGSTMFSTPD